MGISLVAFWSFLGYFFQWSVSKSVSFVFIPILESAHNMVQSISVGFIFGELNICEYHS